MDSSRGAVPDSQVVAMVLLEELCALSVESFRQSWAVVWPDFEPPDEIVVRDGTYSVFEFRIGDPVGYVALVPAPVPMGELERPVAKSCLWNGERVGISHSQAHVVARVKGGRSIADAHMQLTRVLVAVSHATSALGVYWGAAGHLVQADVFEYFARRHAADGLPVELWIAVPVRTVAGRNSLVTYGAERVRHSGA